MYSYNPYLYITAIMIDMEFLSYTLIAIMSSETH